MNMRNKPCPCGSGKKVKNCHFHEPTRAKQRQQLIQEHRTKIETLSEKEKAQ